MSRKEFLDILEEQLSEQLQEGKVAAHIRYYEDYIQSQVNKGISEKEVKITVFSQDQRRPRRHRHNRQHEFFPRNPH